LKRKSLEKFEGET